MISAHEALERLRDGNRRFVSGDPGRAPASRRRWSDPGRGQRPFAIILGCADSRVPPEIIFDQGVGDLFVVRVAGNVVTPTQLGSIEYAAVQLGTPLVVVLGHTDCGAVRATVDACLGGAEELSPALRAIVDEVRPSVERVAGAQADRDRDPDALARQAIRANVAASVRGLREGSPVLAERMHSGRLVVVGAEYELDTGLVVLLTDEEIG